MLLVKTEAPRERILANHLCLAKIVVSPSSGSKVWNKDALMFGVESLGKRYATTCIPPCDLTVRFRDAVKSPIPGSQVDGRMVLLAVARKKRNSFNKYF